MKSRCPNPRCRHVHAQGVPCHVFVPTRKLMALDSDSDSYSDSDDDDDEEDGDEDESLDLGGMTTDQLEDLDRAEEEAARQAAEDSKITMADVMKMGKKGLALMTQGGKALAEGLKHGAHAAKMTGKRAAGRAQQKLATPDWVQRVHYRRCNCDYGVPLNDPAYVPVSKDRYVGGIAINFGDCAPVAAAAGRAPPPATCLGGAFPFLNPRSLARAKSVSTLWSTQVTRQPHYHDMQNFRLICEIEAHNRRIDGCLAFRGFAFTSGDNCIKAWDMREFRGTLAHTCCKDTCPVTAMLEVDAFLYLGSANGALRQWSLPFNVKNIDFRGSMWLHNKVINDMAHWRKGVASLLFTVADDRQCRVWDLTVNRCVHIIEPIDRASGTLRSVTCSENFLFIGSSNGSIYVYLTERRCRRWERHVCHLPAGPVDFCPQTNLRHGTEEQRPIVSALEVGGKHHQEEFLFSGGHDGRIQIFALPEEGLDFPLLHIIEHAHAAAVTAIVSSWAGMISAGDDGAIRIFNVYSENWEHALERCHRVDGRVKCLFVADENDIENQVAFLYVGTNRGTLLMYRLGAYI